MGILDGFLRRRLLGEQLEHCVVWVLVDDLCDFLQIVPIPPFHLEPSRILIDGLRPGMEHVTQLN